MGHALLSQLPDGQSATVRQVTAATSSALTPANLQRLQELGFMPGESVCVLRRGPGGREPLAVQIGQTLFALREAEAQCIEVEVQNPHHAANG